MELTFNEIKSFYLDALAELGVAKADIVQGEEDIFCRCPICGDSKNKKKKRLHLYKKDEVINVNCFNGGCAAKNMTAWNFFKIFTPRVFEQFKLFNRRRYLDSITHKVELETISATAESLGLSSELSKSNKILEFVNSISPDENARGENFVKLQRFCRTLTRTEREEFKMLLTQVNS